LFHREEWQRDREVIGRREVHLFDRRCCTLQVHDDPDVKPNKGATKALVAIDGLGGLPNLSLEPHKRTPAVVRVAKDAGIKIKTSKASAGEEQRAKMAVLAIINGAEGRIKKAKTEVELRATRPISGACKPPTTILRAPTCILTHRDAASCVGHLCLATSCFATCLV
jgi:hypothetical protein